MLRGYFAGSALKIMFDDLPNVDRILQVREPGASFAGSRDAIISLSIHDVFDAMNDDTARHIFVCFMIK